MYIVTMIIGSFIVSLLRGCEARCVQATSITCFAHWSYRCSAKSP